MNMHPADAKLVIERGWGQRHPLSKYGWWVPKEFVMVYAPRDKSEVEVVAKIVEAATWWVGGVKIDVNVGGDEEKD